jgi:hypothetical protein
MVNELVGGKMNTIEQSYENSAQELKRRIIALIPDHPEIMNMTEPFDLFKIEGFKCDDLQPSLGQAMGALAFAKKEYASNVTGELR